MNKDLERIEKAMEIDRKDSCVTFCFFTIMGFAIMLIATDNLIISIAAMIGCIAYLILFFIENGKYNKLKILYDHNYKKDI